MDSIQIDKKFDLEERTLDFSKKIIHLCQKLPNNRVNYSLTSQLIRSATSIGANYREANDALGKKDFAYRARISRKEAKETIYWLELILEANPFVELDIGALSDECTQLRNILSSIIKKVDITS